jgi:hypothetical protein
MIEKEVQKKIATSAQVLGLWYYKIPDFPASMGYGSDIRYSPVKPCDCIIASQGRIAFLELKAMKENRLPFACIRESQAKHMTALVQAQMPIYLLVYWTPGKRLYAFPWEWWVLQEQCMTRKSLPIDSDELARSFAVAEVTHGQRVAQDGHLWGGRWAWDLRPLLGIVEAKQGMLKEVGV